MTFHKVFLLSGGAEVPLTGEQPTFYPEIHGEHGLGPIIPNDDHSLKIENFLEIVNLNVKEFYIMGGAFWIPGNVTTVAEANFHGDPVAVNIVLTYANNVTIIPLNATQKAIVTPEMVTYIEQFGKTKIFKPLMDYYTGFYKERDPSLKGSPVHDALTLMAAIHPEMFIFESYPVVVVDDLDGPTRGQSIADTRPYSNNNGEKKHRIAFDIHYEMFFYNFLSVMTGQDLNNGLTEV